MEYMTQINFYIDASTRSRLADAAKSRGVSVSELIRSAIQEYLAKGEEEPS